jgi:hypothetical protein
MRLHGRGREVVKTARGEVEIDVYGEETVQGRRYSTLCECKYWQSAVPQAVIHSFRTVIGDIGVNKGYIISKSGFQSGSFSAAELTNVELATWDQFQAAFEKSWLENYFSPHITERLDPLLSYAEPILPAWFGDLPEPDKEEFMSLKEKYDEFGWFVMSLATYSRMIRKQGYPALPLAAHKEYAKLLSNAPREIVEARGYRELLRSCIVYGEQAIKEFRAIRDRNNLKGGE